MVSDTSAIIKGFVFLYYRFLKNYFSYFYFLTLKFSKLNLIIFLNRFKFLSFISLNPIVLLNLSNTILFFLLKIIHTASLNFFY